MANTDMTLGVDAKVNRVLGLGKFESFGKQIQKIITKAVEEGVLDGVRGGQDIISKAFGKVSDPKARAALDKLYRAGVSKENAIMRAADTQRKAEARRAASQAANKKRRQAEVDAAEAVVAAYSPYAYSDSMEGFTNATIARQAYGVLTRVSNYDIVPVERRLSATGSKLHVQEYENFHRRNIRYDMPFNRLARERAEHNRQLERERARVGMQENEALARQILEARLGYTLSDTEWQQRKYDALFGAEGANEAWLKGGASFAEQAATIQRTAELKAMRSDAVAAFNEEQAESAEEAAESLTNLSKAAKIAGTVLGTASALTTMYFSSKWAAEAKRSTHASNVAYYQRWEQGGQMVGSAVGSIGGLIAAGALGAGPIGAAVAAVIGGIGLGGLGSLFGKYKQSELEGITRTISETTNARRDNLLYGSHGYTMGAVMESAGMGTASDLNNMRWTGQMLPGAMALGMVGEQEMLMLSLMPEYFAALMSGADSATLAKAYAASVENLPAQLRPVVATMAPGGSQGMYINARDPFFNSMLNRGAEFARADSIYGGMSNFVVPASITRSLTDQNKGIKGAAKDVYDAMIGESSHQDYFNFAYSNSTLSPGVSIGVQGAKEVLPGISDLLEAKDVFRGIKETGLNLTIRIDGIGESQQSFDVRSLMNGQTAVFNVGGQ
jgi:hypothetical protein